MRLIAEVKAYILYSLFNVKKSFILFCNKIKSLYLESFLLLKLFSLLEKSFNANQTRKRKKYFGINSHYRKSKIKDRESKNLVSV